MIKPRGEGGRIPIPVRMCLMVGIDQTCLPATQSGGGVRMPCKGGGSGLDGIARRLGGPDGVLVVFSPRVVVLPDLRPSICGRQSASVPRAAAARAAAWHPSSVSNFFIMAWGSAGCPVSASNTRMYPAVSILKHRAAAVRCGSGLINVPLITALSRRSRRGRSPCRLSRRSPGHASSQPRTTAKGRRSG